MKKLSSLSFFFFLGAASVHALQIFSSHAPLEVRSEMPAYYSLAPTQSPTCPPRMGAEDTISNSCFEAVLKGDLGELCCLLWDRSKSETVVSSYCEEAESQAYMLPEIKRLISDFVCLFKEANEIKYDNIKYEKGMNLLHAACTFPSEQSSSIVALILTLNIDVNAQSEYGRTALHYLCDHRYLRAWEEPIVAMFDLIVKKGGSCKVVKKNTQENPLHTLCKHRFSSTPLSLKHLKRFKGEEVINAVDCYGMTPLHWLCDKVPLSSFKKPKSTCMRTLLIDVKRVAYYRQWRDSGCVEGIRYLLTHGGLPSLRIQASNGYTPYDVAYNSGFRKPFVFRGIVCCNQKIFLPGFYPSRYADDTEKDLLLAVDPLAGSVCPKLSYCCWATRLEVKMIIITCVFAIVAATVARFTDRYIV